MKGKKNQHLVIFSEITTDVNDKNFTKDAVFQFIGNQNKIRNLIPQQMKNVRPISEFIKDCVSIHYIHSSGQSPNDKKRTIDETPLSHKKEILFYRDPPITNNSPWRNITAILTHPMAFRDKGRKNPIEVTIQSTYFLDLQKIGDTESPKYHHAVTSEIIITTAGGVDLPYPHILGNFPGIDGDNRGLVYPTEDGFENKLNFTMFPIIHQFPIHHSISNLHEIFANFLERKKVIINEKVNTNENIVHKRIKKEVIRDENILNKVEYTGRLTRGYDEHVTPRYDNYYINNNNNNNNNYNYTINNNLETIYPSNPISSEKKPFIYDERNALSDEDFNRYLEKFATSDNNNNNNNKNFSHTIYSRTGMNEWDYMEGKRDIDEKSNIQESVHIYENIHIGEDDNMVDEELSPEEIEDLDSKAFIESIETNGDDRKIFEKMKKELLEEKRNKNKYNNNNSNLGNLSFSNRNENDQPVINNRKESTSSTYTSLLPPISSQIPIRNILSGNNIKVEQFRSQESSGDFNAQSKMSGFDMQIGNEKKKSDKKTEAYYVITFRMEKKHSFFIVVPIQDMYHEKVTPKIYHTHPLLATKETSIVKLLETMMGSYKKSNFIFLDPYEYIHTLNVEYPHIKELATIHKPPKEMMDFLEDIRIDTIKSIIQTNGNEVKLTGKNDKSDSHMHYSFSLSSPFEMESLTIPNTITDEIQTKILDMIKNDPLNIEGLNIKSLNNVVDPIIDKVFKGILTNIECVFFSKVEFELRLEVEDGLHKPEIGRNILSNLENIVLRSMRSFEDTSMLYFVVTSKSEIGGMGNIGTMLYYNFYSITQKAVTHKWQMFTTFGQTIIVTQITDNAIFRVDGMENLIRRLNINPNAFFFVFDDESVNFLRKCKINRRIPDSISKLEHNEEVPPLSIYSYLLSIKMLAGSPQKDQSKPFIIVNENKTKNSLIGYFENFKKIKNMKQTDKKPSTKKGPYNPMGKVLRVLQHLFPQIPTDRILAEDTMKFCTDKLYMLCRAFMIRYCSTNITTFTSKSKLQALPVRYKDRLYERSSFLYTNFTGPFISVQSFDLNVYNSSKINKALRIGNDLQLLDRPNNTNYVLGFLRTLDPSHSITLENPELSDKNELYRRLLKGIYVFYVNLTKNTNHPYLARRFLYESNIIRKYILLDIFKEIYNDLMQGLHKTGIVIDKIDFSFSRINGTIQPTFKYIFKNIGIDEGLPIEELLSVVNLVNDKFPRNLIMISQHTSLLKFIHQFTSHGNINHNDLSLAFSDFFVKFYANLKLPERLDQLIEQYTSRFVTNDQRLKISKILNQIKHTNNQNFAQLVEVVEWKNIFYSIHRKIAIHSIQNQSNANEKEDFFLCFSHFDQIVDLVYIGIANASSHYYHNQKSSDRDFHLALCGAINRYFVTLLSKNNSTFTGTYIFNITDFIFENKNDPNSISTLIPCKAIVGPQKDEFKKFF